MLIFIKLKKIFSLIINLITKISPYDKVIRCKEETIFIGKRTILILCEIHKIIGKVKLIRQTSALQEEFLYSYIPLSFVKFSLV